MINKAYKTGDLFLFDRLSVRYYKFPEMLNFTIFTDEVPLIQGPLVSSFEAHFTHTCMGLLEEGL